LPIAVIARPQYANAQVNVLATSAKARPLGQTRRSAASPRRARTGLGGGAQEVANVTLPQRLWRSVMVVVWARAEAMARTLRNDLEAWVSLLSIQLPNDQRRAASSLHPMRHANIILPCIPRADGDSIRRTTPKLRAHALMEEWTRRAVRVDGPRDVRRVCVMIGCTGHLWHMTLPRHVLSAAHLMIQHADDRRLT